MTKRSVTRRAKIVTVIGIVVLLLAVALILWKVLTPAATPQQAGDSADTTQSSTDSADQDAPGASTDDDGSTAATPVIVPDTITYIDVAPLAIRVGYTKGIPGFEFSVMRASGGTLYAEFSAPSLVGTKCTNDGGVFASIIQAPTPDEVATAAQTVVVAGTAYGLLLSGETCTANPVLLRQYQAAFSAGFPYTEPL